MGLSGERSAARLLLGKGARSDNDAGRNAAKFRLYGAQAA
jgi:hypothetical protein